MEDIFLLDRGRCWSVVLVRRDSRFQTGSEEIFSNRSVLKTRRNIVEGAYIPLMAATNFSALSLSAAVVASFKKTKQYPRF